MTRVTIIGGGYGGIAVAKALDDACEVALVEQKDTFVNHAAALRATVDREALPALRRTSETRTRRARHRAGSGGHHGLGDGAR